MRNLKRVLALAMAMVMTLGMMVIGANAASYTDAAQISDDYAEAIEVLTGMGVFQGQGEGNFAPKATLTRAEASALIYRVLTADVTDAKKALYDYSSFDDVKEGAWYTGYITYAANGGYVKGYGDGNFGPNDKVTGVQVLAIMLRAMGYGQKGEFEGAGWKDNTLTTAHDLGLLDNINVTNSDDLDKPATRELVAQILFDAIQVPTTTYTPAFGYWTSTQKLGDKFTLAGPTDTTDDWGRPGYKYTYTTGNKSTSFSYAPISTYYTAVAECQIASDLGLDGNKEYGVTTYTNGVINNSTTNINPVDTVNKIGAQGRLTEVYKIGDTNRIVMIDTFLAKVDKVVPATYDAAGHLKTESALYLTVYDRADGIKIVETNGAKDYSYTVGDKLLVNVQTHQPAVYNTVDTTTAPVVNTAGYVGAKLLEIEGYSSTVVGVQTIIWQNAAKHTVAGTTYDDAVEYHKDDAANIANKQFTWCFDAHNNLIGSFSIQDTYTYATIRDIQWINPTGAYGYAQATLVYVDGTTESVTVKSIDRDANGTIASNEVLTGSAFYGDYDTGVVSINWGYNAQTSANASYLGQHLFAVSKDANGVAYLTQIQTTVTSATVTKSNPVITDGASGYAYVDDSTQFLVRTTVNGAYVYTPVTGYNQMPSLTSATVYYVNLDNDAAAEIVYMYGTAATTTSSNLVYIANTSYSYVVGTSDYITLKGAYINGTLTDVTVNKEWLDGAGTELQAKEVYYMVDTNGDGKVNATAGETVTLIGTTPVTINATTNTNAVKLTAGSYSVLNNAIEVTGQVVPYNITSATTYGTFTGNETIVIVYTGYNVSAIYVL